MEHILTCDDLELDCECSVVRKDNGQEQRLSPRELQLLMAAFKAGGRLALNTTQAGMEQADRAAISRLRSKLRPLGFDLVSDRGNGYRVASFDYREAAVFTVGLWLHGNECANRTQRSIKEAFQATMKQCQDGQIVTRLHERRTDNWTEDVISETLNEFDNAGVVAIVGLDSAAASLLLESKRELELHKIPVLSPIASSGMLCAGDNAHRLFYRCRGGDRPLIKELSDWIVGIVAEHRRDSVLPLVQTARSGATSYGEQNYQVFRQFAKNQLCILPELMYPNTMDSAATAKWAERIRHDRPTAIVTFGFAALIAPLCRIASDIDANLVIYTIDPPPEWFINPTINGSWEVSDRPIEGLRAVVSSTYPLGPGDTTAVTDFRRTWTAQHSDAPWTYRHALLGHDTACILYSALREAIRKGGRGVDQVRKYLPEMLEHNSVNPGTLLSDGIFTSDRELAFRCRRVQLRNGQFEGYWYDPKSGS